MVNKFKYLILFLIFLGILLPEPVSAVVGTGLFDIFDHMLHGISEKTQIMIFSIMLIMFLYLAGLALLHATLNILFVFIVQQPLWIQRLQPMTMAGWDFVVGLANMLLVIVFIVIAFAFIFKLEDLQMKKSLVRLIVIAFLINFSMLFVNMAIDITQILYNTILGAAGPDFWPLVIDTIMGPLWVSILALVVLVIALIVVFSIPIASSLGQIIFAGLYVTLILPFLILLLVQILLFYPLILLFATLAIVFAARVFILQILTILAPLALVSWILPQTRSFWVFWKRTLVEWLTIGVIFLFLLVLGFSVLGLLPPPTPSLPSTVNLPGPLALIGAMLSPIFAFVSYYFAVVIYVGVIVYIGKRQMPEAGKAIMGGLERLGSMAMGMGVGMLKKQGLSAYEKSQKKAEKRTAEKGETKQRLTGIRESKKALDARGAATRLRAAEGSATSPFDERVKLSDEEQKAIGYNKRLVPMDKKTLSKIAKKAEKQAEKHEKKSDKAHIKAAGLKETKKAASDWLIDKEREKTKGKSDAQLKSTLYTERTKPVFLQNLNRIAAILEEIARNGKISGALVESEEIINKAVRGGANLGLILARRPDLANKVDPKLAPEIVGDNPSLAIKHFIENQDPVEFRNKIQIEAAGNPIVAKTILENAGLSEEFGKGKTSIKRALLETAENAGYFNDPQFQEALERVYNDPRWGRQKPKGQTAASQIDWQDGMDY